LELKHWMQKLWVLLFIFRANFCILPTKPWWRCTWYKEPFLENKWINGPKSPHLWGKKIWTCNI
jgi:hypothetical protein